MIPHQIGPEKTPAFHVIFSVHAVTVEYLCPQGFFSQAKKLKTTRRSGHRFCHIQALAQ